jgi:RND superfamily putative drug exporter
LSTPKSTVTNAAPTNRRPPKPSSPNDREIESWLSELRDGLDVPRERPPHDRDVPAPPPRPHERDVPPSGEREEHPSAHSERKGDHPADRYGAAEAATSKPSADQTRALPVPGNLSDAPASDAEATTAIPTPPSEESDSDVATEKLNSRGRRGNSGDQVRQRGSVSAQDLLRREGRF